TGPDSFVTRYRQPLLSLPGRCSTQQRPKLRAWRGRVVERVDKSRVPFSVEDEQALIQQHIDGGLPGGVNHEFSSCLAQCRCRVVDELTRPSFDPQIDAALRIGGTITLDERHFGTMRRVWGRAIFFHTVHIHPRIYIVNTTWCVARLPAISLRFMLH
ncbi:MAG TPA: hypothetical protein VFQ90_15810, partial [Stellaceae bacterium]|nr:hypothetical protein [Stellaceae bacterium]